MKNCFKDFVECNAEIVFTRIRKAPSYPENHQSKNTFSLVFDTEQIGCARYALPRLLHLLESYDINATFFITNILKKIYPNLVNMITEQKHEVGLHGKWHEWLSGFELEKQETAIGEIDYGFG